MMVFSTSFDPRLPRFALMLAFAASLALLAGCGPKRPETMYVEGIVTLDGKPVENAAVMFSPAEGRPASGSTDAQGRFELQTFEPRDGAVPGSHKVTVTLNEVSGVMPDPDGLSGEIAPGGFQVKWIVPEKYSNPDSSGLTVEVDRSLDLPVKLELSTGP